MLFGVEDNPDDNAYYEGDHSEETFMELGVVREFLGLENEGGESFICGREKSPAEVLASRETVEDAVAGFPPNDPRQAFLAGVAWVARREGEIFDMTFIISPHEAKEAAELAYPGGLPRSTLNRIISPMGHERPEKCDF